MYSFIYVSCIIVCLCVSYFLYTIFRQIYNTLETHTASPEYRVIIYIKWIHVQYFKQQTKNPTHLRLCSFFHSLCSSSDLRVVLSHNKISQGLILSWGDTVMVCPCVMLTFWSFERQTDKRLLCAWWHSVCSLHRYRRIHTLCKYLRFSGRGAGNTYKAILHLNKVSTLSLF